MNHVTAALRTAKARLVVIGNGMAGMRTVEEILNRAPDKYDITVFGAEPRVNYNRIMLSPLLSGEKDFDEIVINTPEWYTENNIHLYSGDPVVKIDRDRKVVISKSGTETEYDQLLLATGSDPIIIPVPGHKLDGVVTFRDVDDVDTMLGAAAKGGPALGQRGVNIMEFCKAFNAATQQMEPGMPIPVVITVYSDRSFSFVTKTPPASYFLKKAAGIAKGSGTTGKGYVGKVTKAQIKEIAEAKMADLNAFDVDGAMAMIEGSARAMGIEVVE